MILRWQRRYSFCECNDHPHPLSVRGVTPRREKSERLCGGWGVIFPVPPSVWWKAAESGLVPVCSPPNFYNIVRGVWGWGTEERASERSFHLEISERGGFLHFSVCSCKWRAGYIPRCLQISLSLSLSLALTRSALHALIGNYAKRPPPPPRTTTTTVNTKRKDGMGKVKNKNKIPASAHLLSWWWRSRRRRLWWC